MNVGDFVVAIRNSGEKDVLYVIKINEGCIFTMNHNGAVELWRRDDLHKQSTYPSKEFLSEDFLIDGLKTDIISVDITRYSKVGRCRCCNGGFYTRYGEFVPDTQFIYKINLGGDSINLCPTCFSRLKLAMSFPIPESMDEFRVNPVPKDSVTFDVNLFFDLMAELDKPEPSPEEISLIMKGRRKKR